MLDAKPCDEELPERWRSSMAVFRYDPDEAYQPYEDHIVSYIKLVVTITPFAPLIGVDLGSEYVPPVEVDALEEAYPCYGALLHVTVAPSREPGDMDPNDLPYFVDFEPKKRELYELVTDTGEVLSASATTLALGKSGSTMQTTENYNLDTGWNFGMSGSYAGTGGGFTVGETGQEGTVTSSGYQTTNLRESNSSTERRELQSHTTQLSQMYNLFQAYHLGTNRALFFMEPRPHIRQTEASFINGPRALEGIQEVMLAVVRPRTQPEFCVGAVLETAHLVKEPQYAFDTDTDVVQFRLRARAENRDDSWEKDSFTSDPISHTETFYAPDGWEITGYTTSTLAARRVHDGPIVEWTPDLLTIYGAVTWRFREGDYEFPSGYQDIYEDGELNVDVTVQLRKKEPRLTDYVRKLFLSARQLCCCPQARIGFDLPVSVTYTADLPRIRVHQGMMSREYFAQSRLLASQIRGAMVNSLSSSRRRPVDEVAYTDSDPFFTRVTSVLRRLRVRHQFAQPARKAEVLSASQRKLLQPLADRSLSTILETDAIRLARRLRISEEEVLRMKQDLLKNITAEIAKAEAAADERARWDDDGDDVTPRQGPGRSKKAPKR